MAGDYNYLTEKDKEDLWRKPFDSKEAFHNYLSLEETGGTNDKGKDTLTQSKETLDLKTDVNSSDLHNTLKKYSPRTTTGNISLLPNWVSLLSKHFDKVIGILNKLLGETINFNLQNNIATVLCINTEPIKSLLENDLTIIDHDPSEQSWLKAKFEEWKTCINALQSEYFCVIFSEKDFSKTYIGTKVADFKSIDSTISQFRDQCATDVKISHQVMEFLKYNKTFSDLKLQEKTQDEIWIQNVKRCRLAELKKEIKKVTCQSYLLNENEYEFLCEKDNEVLSHVEEKFHMKGHPYQLPMTGDIPMVLQVNQLISISCVVNSDPENIPLDSLIIIDSQTPKPETDYVPIFQEEKYKIFQYESWNSLRNHISVFVPEMKNKTYSWNLIFENCFKIVFTDNNVPHTIGITIPIEIAKNLVQFCQNIFSAVTKLPDNDKKPTCILLFVKTRKMMDDVFNILKTPSAETPNMEDSSRSSESDTKLLDTSPKECSVDVIKGSITDMKVDVVVGSTDSSLTLDGYVSSDLSKKAGPELKRECDRNYPQGISFPQIAMTKGHKLPCNFVFFGSIPENDGKPNITTFVEACLQRVTLLKFSSIAFPALGTGNLGYKPNVVVEQMASAIRTFKTTTPESSLKKIIIVIYPDEKKMDDFFELKKLSTIVKDSKTVPPKKPEPLLQKEQKPALKVKYQQLLWIPFINYSTRRETLDQAVMEFEKGLNYVTFALSHEEAEDLYFFFDLISLVPDIVDQLCLEQGNLLVPRRSSTQFEKHLNELRKHCNKCSYKIPSNVNIKQIRHFLIKINQEYTKVKCELSKDEQEVLFKTFEFERGEEAKHQLDYFLGLRKNISLSKDRFNTNKQESDDIKEHSQLPPEGDSRNEAPRSTTQSTQNIQNICCFQMGDSLLVKVYQADILNVDVDGIVNAANKWLAHGGGVARAIINAAGDVVNTEGQRKRNGRTLNDGEVLSTSAGKLTRYRNIIHAVGPVNTLSSRYCKKKLEETVYNSLIEANQLGLHSVALPAISSGIFGVPLDICTNAYVMGVKEFYKTKPSDCQLKEIHFVDMNPVTYKAIKDDFAKQLSEVRAVTGNTIHQSKDNSANISSNGKDENTMAMEDTENTIQQSKDNAANISSYGKDENTMTMEKTENTIQQSKDNSANISSNGKDENTMTMEDTENTIHQSKDNSANISSDGKDENTADINAKTCVKCKREMPEPQLLKCNHTLCSNCKKTLSQPMCPSCQMPFGIFYGDQPNGKMVVTEMSNSLPGFQDTATYEIVYTMDDNKWKTPKKAYLPKNEDGNLILKMLQLAFTQRLIFTFQESSKGSKSLIWNDIHHKTSRFGKLTGCGYPDPDYFQRVTKELAAKGITPDLVAKKEIENEIEI